MTVIHVSAGAAPGGDGSPSHPYASIQQAIDSAGAGDTIAVGPGTYTENIRFDSGGRDGAPLRLVSSGGPGAATITPADDALDTVDIAGADHIEISGFTLVGGSDATRQVVHVHGIDNGANFASGVVIADNVILRGAGDGIKGSKAEDLTLSGNTISGGGATEAGIDCVGVNRLVIADNRLNDMPYVGIMVKGGSTDVVISGNTVSGAGHTGIEVGGYTDSRYYPPGFLAGGGDYEAGNVLISGNTITNSGNAALRLIGAQGVLISGNLLGGTNALVKIDDSSLFHDPWFASDIGFVGNSVSGNWLIDRADRAVIWWQQAAVQAFDDWRETPGPAPIAEPVPISGSAAADRLTGTAADDHFLGLGGNDRIEAGAGNDRIEGGDGADTLRGAAGSDFVQGGNGNDRIEGGDGNDTLRGAAGNDRIRGDAGQDNLAGEAGNDTLEGGAGNDTLNAGAGSDTLRGGAGADVFVFRLDTGFGAERIDDFSLSAGDQIAFAGFGAGLDGFGDLDSNRNGQLDDGDALVRVASGQTYIDLSRFYGHATGTDVIRITEDHLDSTDFRFLPG